MRFVSSAVVCVVAAAFVACGGGSVSGPSSIPSESPSSVSSVVPARLPSFMYGAFAASEDVPEAAANPGNVVLVVPTYSDDAERVAMSLQSNGKVAILSAHHVFGNPEGEWAAGWANTKKWAEPLTKRGLVAAVYVVDEPLHNGIPAATRDKAIAIVRADGFRTIVFEGVDQAIRSARAPSDYYGATCYTWAGHGSWSLDRCLTAYADRPDWNLVAAQGYDLQETVGYNGPAGEQIARWARMAREKNKAGVVYWVWAWDGQTGIRDDHEVLTAYRSNAR